MSEAPTPPGEPPASLSQRAFARLVGCSHVLIGRLVRQGRLPTTPEGLLPMPAAQDAYQARSNAKPVTAGGNSAPQGNTTSQAVTGGNTAKPRPKGKRKATPAKGKPDLHIVPPPAATPDPRACDDAGDDDPEERNDPEHERRLRIVNQLLAQAQGDRWAVRHALMHDKTLGFLLKKSAANRLIRQVLVRRIEERSTQDHMDAVEDVRTRLKTIARHAFEAGQFGAAANATIKEAELDGLLGKLQVAVVNQTNNTTNNVRVVAPSMAELIGNLRDLADEEMDVLLRLTDRSAVATGEPPAAR